MSQARVLAAKLVLLSTGTVGVLGISRAIVARGQDVTTARTEATKPQPSDELARSIDAYVEKRLAKEGIAPAPPADDAEFLRRVYLDLCGTTPAPSETMAFLADRDSEKRRKKVDELIARPETARNWADYWTDVMDGEATTKRREDQIKGQLRTWFEDELKNNVPFDEITRRLVSAEGYIQDNGAVGYLLSYTDMGNQPDPKQLAATTARVFMGLQIECAQCHNHPFADWKRDDFMGLAAFFTRAKRDQEKIMLPGGLTRKQIEALPAEERAKVKMEFQKAQQKAPYGVMERPNGEFYAEVQTVRNPGDPQKPMNASGKTATPAPAPPPPPQDPKNKNKNKPKGGGDTPTYLVMPKFIATAVAVPTISAETKRRQLLAQLITADGNPYFAKCCANRIWGRLTGRPLVAPTEDLSDENAPHDPELLSLLAKGFKKLRYDHRAMLRALCLTCVYARSSRSKTDTTDKEEYAKLVHSEQLYAQGVVRPIDARPLAHAVVTAIVLGEQSLDETAGKQQEGLLRRFERLFGESNLDPKKYEETIPQALFLINGQGTNRGGRPYQRAKGKGADVRGPMLTEDPKDAMGKLLARYDDPRERVTRIYLAALCRPPRKAELDDALAYVKDGGQDLYEDLLWALVNSAEFRFNR
jgi:hypothetical protein